MCASLATLERLPQYLRILKCKREEGVTNISSTMIANELGLSSIQVRKDLALVSKNDGRPGVGFELDEIIADIEEFLAMRSSKDVIIVGAGRIGQALLNYNQFENDAKIIMAFDNDEKKCNDTNIIHMSKLKKFVKRKNVHIGIITVPKEAAQEVCDLMIDCGIKAIWNFAPINLKVPDDVVIKNEDLSASLLILTKKLEDRL